MRRANPKLLVAIAALLTVLLVAYVFAGEGSRTDGPPSDRLTDRQAGVTAPPQAPPPPQDDPMMTLSPEDSEAAPEPEVEPEPPVSEPPVVRPAPPPPPTRTAEAKPRPKAAPPPPTKPRAPAPPRTAQATPPSPAPPTATIRPSFNCRYARTRSEIAVCSDPGLASLDRQMAAQFTNAVRQGTPAQRDVLERSRLRFLYRRDRCATAACIAAAYRARMNEISDIAARTWREP